MKNHYGFTIFNANDLSTYLYGRLTPRKGAKTLNFYLVVVCGHMKCAMDTVLINDSMEACLIG